MRTSVAIAILMVGLRAPAFAQFPHGIPSPDSLVRLLGSPDWQVRSHGVAYLNALPANRLPDNYAETVIQLLEREATSPHPHTEGEGEGYGEYLIAVMDGAVRLRDPRSLRGLALLGIQMSRAAQEYVASQGPASLPYLDEAWARDSMGLGRSGAVSITWAYMLGPYRQALSRADRLQVMAHLPAMLPRDPLDFSWAAATVPLPEAVPLLEDIAASDPSNIVRGRASGVLGQLRPGRDQLSPHELLGRLIEWVDALSLHAAGGKIAVCQKLRASLIEAAGQTARGDVGAARAALEAFGRQGRDALAAQELTAVELRFLVGNTEYLKGRLTTHASER